MLSEGMHVIIVFIKTLGSAYIKKFDFYKLKEAKDHTHSKEGKMHLAGTAFESTENWFLDHLKYFKMQSKSKLFY